MSEVEIGRKIFQVKLLYFIGRLMVTCMTVDEILGKFRAYLMSCLKPNVVNIQSSCCRSPWVNICSLVYSAKNFLDDLLQLCH